MNLDILGLRRDVCLASAFQQACLVVMQGGGCGSDVHHHPHAHHLHAAGVALTYLP